MDTFDKKTRSNIMRAVKSKNTGLEQRFVDVLEGAGVDGFVMHPAGLTGNPDLVFEDAKVAVFVDSCFWHGCPKHLRRPSSNKAYWNEKIDRNVRRDRRKRAALRRKGWSVLHVWEHDLKNPKPVIRRIERKLAERRAD